MQACKMGCFDFFICKWNSLCYWEYRVNTPNNFVITWRSIMVLPKILEYLGKPIFGEFSFLPCLPPENLHYKANNNWIWKQKISYHCLRLNHDDSSQPFFFKTFAFLRNSDLLQINEKPLIVALLWLLLLLENRWK